MNTFVQNRQNWLIWRRLGVLRWCLSVVFVLDVLCLFARRQLISWTATTWCMLCLLSHNLFHPSSQLHSPNVLSAWLLLHWIHASVHGCSLHDHLNLCLVLHNSHTHNQFSFHANSCLPHANQPATNTLQVATYALSWTQPYIVETDQILLCHPCFMHPWELVQ